MSDDKSFRDRVLDRVYGNTRDTRNSGKKKYSKIVLLIDIALLAVIFMLYYNRDDDSIYESSVVNYGDVKIRFSAASEHDEKSVIYTLSMKSSSRAPLTLRFPGEVGKICIRTGETDVDCIGLGEGVDSITLQPDTPKTFAAQFNISSLRSAFRLTSEYKPPKPGLFSPAETSAAIVSTASINLEPRIETSLTYRIGVPYEK